MKTLTIFFYFLLVPFVLLAQGGNVQGTVSDENGLPLPGANVFINSISKGAISDFDGNFTLVDIPEGSYMLMVTYLGYQDKEQEITVAENTTTVVSLSISQKTVELDGVEVTGYKSNGQAKALNTQKNNLNITNVVSTDQIGKFPDTNIGDAVKRIPGITMQVDQGEARNVIVRGLAPQLNSVTLNGSRVPSAEGDNRNVQMDLIPSDMIQTIQVSKAVTPDMEGDALGGAVNLITRSSPKSFRLSATVGSGIAFITDKPIYNASFILGDRSKNGKFGWMLSSSYNDVNFGSDNVEAEWVNEAESELTGNDIEVAPYVAESDIRTYLVQRVRRSYSANMDYAFDDNNSIFLKTMYNWRDDRENRFRVRYRKIAPTFFPGTENINGYEGEIRRQTKGGIDNNRNKNRRLEDQRMQNYSLGGKHLWGNLKLDWMASYAAASEERLNERYAEYELDDKIGLNANLSNPRFPSFSATNPADVALDAFGLRELTEQNQFTEEKDVNAFVNVELPANFFGGNNGILKFGGRYKDKNKNRNNDFFELSPTGAGFATLAEVETADETKADFLAGSQYAAGRFMKASFLGKQNFNDPTLFDKETVESEYLPINFDVKEQVYAGYLMANQDITDKFSVLFGVRVENTQISTIGNEVLFNEDGDFTGVNQIEAENSYTNVLPGVHFKYNASANTVLRFAWSNTIARPNYSDLVPFRNVIAEDEEIETGNANLKATTAMNFDVMAEHYFSSVGVLSGGVFYKDLQDFVYESRTKDTSGGATDGFDVFQPLNGDNAAILGAEFAFQRQLDFLPGFAKNFSLYLNYTLLSSSTDGIRSGDNIRQDVDLPGTTPNMFNASLAYTVPNFNIRMSLNYSDAYIDELGDNEFTDRYYDEQLFLDLNANYNINKKLQVYASLNNITDQPLRYFQGTAARTQQVEFYEKRLTLGLKYDLFKK